MEAAIESAAGAASHTACVSGRKKKCRPCSRPEDLKAGGSDSCRSSFCRLLLAGDVSLVPLDQLLIASTGCLVGKSWWGNQ